MDTKITSCLVLVLLVLLSGCVGQQPSPKTEAASAPAVTQKSTDIVQVPSFTPEYQTPIPSPTVIPTDTPELKKTTASPTSTPKISLFQELQSVPKGTYTLISGKYESHEDYAYLLLDDTGAVVRKFQLRSSADAFSSDLRFYALNNGTGYTNYWIDTADTKETRHHFANNCDKASWSKDNSRLAMLCGDGVRFFEFQDGEWQKTSQVIKPDEIKILPDDMKLLDFPFWMNDGFAYFINAGKEFIYLEDISFPLYILRQECITDPQKCDLSQPNTIMYDDSRAIMAVALSEDDQLLAVAFGAHANGEIRVYDFQTFEVVSRISFPTNDKEDNWSQVYQMIWGSQPNQLILSMNSSTRIYTIPDYRKSEIELLYDCPAAKLYYCSILTKVIVR